MHGNKPVLFTEPVPILTIHSHRMAFMDVLGGDFHFALCVNQPVTGVPHGIEHIINNRISMPLGGVIDALPFVIARLPELAADQIIARLCNAWSRKLAS